MDWLLTREAVIGLALVAALASTASSILQVQGVLSPQRARQLNVAGDVLMGVSMLLFIVVGYRT